MISTGMGLIYLGEFGTGKTMLVSLVAKELVKLGYTVFFTTFAEMIDMFTKSWSSNTARARFESKVVESEIFILDDVGKEFRTKTNLAESTFDHVLRQRAVDARPTMLTTNMSEDELDEGYGGAIFSLLKERSILHKSKGNDWRGKARDRTLEEVLSGEVRPIV
jgi:DNA replication protein DnaC